jgi:LPXTG-site transpeptidase (sortase) family protein
MIVAGAGIYVHIILFYYHSDTRGALLIRQEKADIQVVRSGKVKQGSKPGSTCQPTNASVAGLLQIPAIGLIAPVVQGDGSLELSTSIGHNQSSVWPGGNGTTVFDGHDVTWFHNLPHLHPGERISYVSACDSINYRVTSVQVVEAGAPIYNKPGQLDLVTCYPVDALYYTSQRMVVHARQIGATKPNQAIYVAKVVSAPRSGVPGKWRNLATLNANPVVEGTLVIQGDPANVWTQSTVPLNALANLHDAYFGALREAEIVNATQWAGLQPDIAYADVVSMHGQSVTGTYGSLGTVLNVRGEKVLGGQVREEVLLSRGSRVLITASAMVVSDHFEFTSWQMSIFTN